MKAAEATKMSLDEGTAHMAKRTYHVHLHNGDTWHYPSPGDGARRVYCHCRSVSGRATTYQPSPRLQKNECGRREERSRGERQRRSGQCGPSGAQGTTGETG